MKKRQKGLLLMSATALCSVLCGGVLLNQSVQASTASFAMEEGASVRISTDKADAGIRFTAQIGEVEQGAQYGMLIVRNDWLTSWNITDNYVPQVQEKFDNLAVNNDQDATNNVVAPIKEATPFQDEEDGNKWKIRGSLIGVLEDNYDQEFFGIAYKKVGNDYTYATVENAGDNVRSISDVALGAMIDDTEAKNNTTDAQTCFGFYTDGAARLSGEKTVTVANENADKDLTFEIKATETYKTATSAIDFAITGDKNASLQLNSESDMDGEFIVESEAGADGWYTVTVNSDLYDTDNTLSITVADKLVMRNLNWVAHNDYAITADSSVSLLTPKTVDNKDHDFKKSQALSVTSEKAWTIESANAGVVSASGNTVNAVASGDTSVVVKSRFATSTPVAVRVSYPISSASELDYLAMVTYTHSKADAEKYLSANYLFTDNIDYSTHERNYILPIASVNHEHGRYQYSGGKWIQGEDYENLDRTDTGEFSMGGLTRGTYYSVGWKDVLGLEEVTTTVGSTANVYYLKNTAESGAGYQEEGVVYGTYEDEFRGINPNGLAFAGRIDGNGYAIQNAFYMMDNLQGQARSGSVAAQNSKGYSGLGGFFVGYNIGTIENLEMHVSVANPANYYYNNGVYSKTQQDSSKKINELYLNDAGTAQKMFLHSKGGVHTALTGKYNPHKGSQGIGATGIVGVNNGVLQNLYHKVNVYASIAEIALSAQGVIASINGYKISNCVVDKIDNAYLTGESTLATVTLDKDAGTQDGKPTRWAFVNAIRGSEITGCYSLLKRTGTSSAYKAIPKALTYAEADYDGKLAGGTIDALSNTVYTSFTGTTAVQNWNADYAAMYQAYQTNNNLDGVIWNITENAASIGLRDGLTSVR